SSTTVLPTSVDLPCHAWPQIARLTSCFTGVIREECSLPCAKINGSSGGQCRVIDDPLEICDGSAAMMRSAKMAVVAVVLACAGAAAADAAWTSVDDAASKRGSAGAFVVLLAKADDADVAALEKLMDDKKVKATGDPTLFVRIEPGDADTVKKLDLAPKGSEKTIVLDGYGTPVDHKDKLMTADQLAKALKTARDATAKKH